MRKITKQQRIDSMIDRYKLQYSENYFFDNRISSNDILNLLKREKPLTEDFIIKTIGNKTWTELICDECGSDCIELVTLYPRYGKDCSINICKSCLIKASSL